MDISLEAYKTFYYVAKTGSFSNAANLLFISQPAVSQSVRQLEQALGTKLFTRGKKNVSLTPQGETLFKYVEQGYSLIRLGEDKVLKADSLESGEIRIGASDMTLRFCLLPYLEKLKNLYPRIRFKISNAPTPQTISALSHGEIDFGVVSQPLDAYRNIDIIEADTIRDVFVANDRFKALRGRTVTLAEIAQYPMVMLESGTSTRKYIDAFLTSHGVLPDPEIELATSDLIVQFAIKGFGVASIVRNFAKEEIEKGNLFEIITDVKLPERKLCVILPKDRELSPAAQRLVSLMRQSYIR